MTKKGMRTFDSREAVLALGATSYDAGTALEVVLRHTEPVPSAPTTCSPDCTGRRSRRAGTHRW